MTKSIFIATTEPYSGKSIVALGVINMLLGKAKRIGYFKPVINADPLEKKDSHIQTILEYFGLNVNYEDTYAFTRPQVMRLTENEGQGNMMNTIIRKFKKIDDDYDFTVVEGSDYLGEGTAFEFELNLSIAKNLNAPVIIVSSGENKTIAEIVSAVLNVVRSFASREVQVLAVVVNKIHPQFAEDVRQLLGTQLAAGTILAIIPVNQALLSPSMKEILENLQGTLLVGEEQLSNQVDNVVIGAMNVPHFLNHIKENVLIITPGDRGDMIIAALQANLSTSYPKVSGIVLTAGFQPEEPIMRLLKGLQTVIPILLVETGTFETSTRIGAIKSRITPDNIKKIHLGISTFERYVDVQALDQKIVTFKPEGITPHMFQYQLAKWAKKILKHIVLPEGNDDRILQATARLVSEGSRKTYLAGRS